MALYIDNWWPGFIRFLKISLTTLVVSMFVFQFAFNGVPYLLNTKNLMAGAGFIVLIFQLIARRGWGQAIQMDLLVAFIAACSVSLMSYISMTINNTWDNTYLSYWSTFCLWMLSGYFAVNFIKLVHGYVSLILLVQYLAAVCVMQCVLALLFDNVPALSDFFARFVFEVKWGQDSGRMYGLGCALDPAGVRFSGMLVLISHYCIEASRKKQTKRLTVALFCFLFTILVGSMISRTTIVGTALAIGYWVIVDGKSILTRVRKLGRLWRILLIILCIIIPVMVFLYNTNEKMHDNLRFGFEGFFSIAEKGEWQTDSNDHLETMVHWPDNTHTWIIGDGYMVDPGAFDPFLQSIGYHGDVFYMSTDIGYCRFIFYFGIIGLAVFMLYFLTLAIICKKRYPKWGLAFFFVLGVNYIVWAKVATDVFAVFAIAMSVSAKENAEREALDAIKREDIEEIENTDQRALEGAARIIEDEQREEDEQI